MSDSATEQALSIRAGDARTIRVAFTNGDAALDLTSATVRIFVNTNATPEFNDATTDVAQLTKDGVIVNAAAGIADIPYLAGDTAIASGVYHYAIKAIFDADTVYTGAFGALTIIATP